MAPHVLRQRARLATPAPWAGSTPSDLPLPSFRVSFTALCLLGLVLLGGCSSLQTQVKAAQEVALRTARLQGWAALPVGKDPAFNFAVAAVQRGVYAQGANGAWRFLAGADQDDPRYDRGLRLLALSSEGLELRWAAGMLFRQIAQARRNINLLPEAIGGLERIVSRGLYDEDTLITSFVAAEEFGFIPLERKAFVDFYKGLDLVRRGEDAWAARLFAQLPADSPFAHRAAYVGAVQKIVAGDLAGAEQAFRALQKVQDLDLSLGHDVARSLARLAFEGQRYETALEHYLRLRALAPDDPEILLELAWTYFYLGDARKAVGLLVALDAPVHQHTIAPERYLLEALALRRLCQFDAARLAAVRLERRYADSLKALSEGVLPGQIPPLREAARLRGFSRRNARFTDRLRWEQARAAELKLEPGLHAFLAALYARGVREAESREEAQLEHDLADLTEELLAAREGVRLIIHELGVALLRGRRRPEGVAEKAETVIPLAGDVVVYPFRGEYWTDELDDLVVFAEDRCID